MAVAELGRVKSIEELDSLIRSIATNTIFSVVFTKRGDGSVRKMKCRLGVKKNQTGAGMAYNPIEKGLMCVWDMQEGSYKMVSLTTIISIRLRGEEHVFKELPTDAAS